MFSGHPMVGPAHGPCAAQWTRRLATFPRRSCGYGQALGSGKTPLRRVRRGERLRSAGSIIGIQCLWLRPALATLIWSWPTCRRCAGGSGGSDTRPSRVICHNSENGFTVLKIRRASPVLLVDPWGHVPRRRKPVCPSCRSSYCTPSRFDEWKKMSFPPGSAMNPNPLSVSFLIVPSGITRPFVVEPLVEMSPA